MLITVLTLLVGCNDDKKPTPNATALHFDEEEMWVGAVDNIRTYNAPYTKQGGGTGATPKIVCNQEWIHIKECMDNNIRFSVDYNPYDEVREGQITIRLGQSSDVITIKQRPHAYSDFEAQSIEGSNYYGKGEDGLHCYYLVLSLSSDGMSNGGFFYDNSFYYCFELYSDRLEEKSIPTGIYTMEDGSIGSENSCIIITSDGKVTERSITQATLTIEDGHIEGRLTYVVNDNERVDNVSYSGSLEILQSNTLSTLESSYNFDNRDAHFITTPMGDIYQNGCYATILHIFDELDIDNQTFEGDMFQIILQHSSAEASIEGKYLAGIGDHRFTEGYTDDSREPLGSWYMMYDWYMDDLVMLNYAPLKSGSIEISKLNTERYEIKINVIDDNNHTIKGSYIATEVGVE